MSLKPLKASDQKKINSMMQKKKKKIEKIHELPPYMYIISEGTKTEPYYIKGMVDEINKKYYDYLSDKRIEVKGTGRNTRSLLNYARKQVEKDFPEAEVVWLMYDKDDFPYDDFDNTQFSAESNYGERKYKVAWSNECIELWFILHFQELNSNVGRVKYQNILKSYFNYEKNLINIYEILKDKTAVAIKRARRQYEEYDKKIPPSQRCPATRVFQLVEELQKYL